MVWGSINVANELKYFTLSLVSSDLKPQFKALICFYTLNIIFSQLCAVSLSTGIPTSS